MAKAVHPQGLAPDTLIGWAAGKLLAAKVAEVSTHAEAATEGDVDGVHDLRIAVKRLREVMRLFRRLMPSRRRQLLMPLVEELNDALGLVRDRDVWAEHLAWVAEQAPIAAEFLEGLGAKWAQERAGHLTETVRLWAAVADDDHLLEGLSGLATATRRLKREENRLPLDRFAYLAVTDRAGRARRRLAETTSLEDSAALHALRITVKRLKYSMEPFLTALPSLEHPYHVVAEVQETVGLTHDYDVLQAGIEEHLAQSPPGSRRGAKRALEVVRAHRVELLALAQPPLTALASDDWQRQLLDSLD